MGQLIGTNAQGARVVLTLNPGRNTIGRSPKNTLPLDEPSISGFHCEIAASDGEVVVKDLNSTNGTSIDGHRIDEAPLWPGQCLQLGSLQLLYEDPALAPPIAVPVRSPVAICRYHPHATAAWRCARCGHFFCEQCVKVRQGPSKVWRLCPICQSDCQSLSAWIEEHQELETRSAQGFFQRLDGAFAYPFSSGGVMLLVGGTVFFSLLQGAGYVIGFAGGLGLVAGIFLFLFTFGYLFAYMQRILVSSAAGEDVVPDWPELSEWGSDIVRPCLMFLSTLAVSFAPAWIYMIMSATAENEPVPALLLTLVGLGMTYFPMALMAVALSDSFLGVNPFVVLPSIARIPGQYLVGVLIFFALVAIRYFGDSLLRLVLPVPLLPTLLVNFMALYFLTVEMRILGLIYWTNRDRLGWFGG